MKTRGEAVLQLLTGESCAVVHAAAAAAEGANTAGRKVVVQLQHSHLVVLLGLID